MIFHIFQQRIESFMMQCVSFPPLFLAPPQALAAPVLMSGKHCVIGAETGSGKSFAYLVRRPSAPQPAAPVG